MTTTVTAKIQLRKGTAAQWTSANPVLLSGEVGFETDTHKFKLGDGTTVWTSLAYYHDPDLAATYATAAHTHTGVYEPANANLQAHVSSTANPHSVTAAQAGADASGTAAGLLASHTAAADPHPGYLTPTEGNVAYAATGHNHTGVYDPAGTAASAVSAHAGGSSVHAIASVTGLQTALDGKSATSHDHAATYAPIAQGVTNGDSHDHSGGDGAQIAYSGLSGLPTLGTAAAQATTAFEAAGAVSTHAALTTIHGISSFGATLVDDADAATARSTLGLASGATTAAYAGAASEIHAATDKATPVDADELGLVDSAASWILKKLTWANLKTTLSSVFAVLAGKSGGQTLIGGTGVTDALTLQGTSGNGTASAVALQMKVGNNGATSALTVLNNGKVGFGEVTSPSAQLEIKGKSGLDGFKVTGYSPSYSSYFVFVNEYGTLVSQVNNAANSTAYIVQLSGDTYGRLAFGLESGVPFLGMGPGAAARDVFFRRSSGDLIFLFGTTPSTKAIITSAGRIGAGVSSASAQLHAVATTEQLRLGYDASNYASFTVSSAGNLTIDTVGNTIYTPDTIENTVNGGGVVLRSSNGTRYMITVTDAGTLSVSTA